jgi:hypothetical protein
VENHQTKTEVMSNLEERGHAATRQRRFVFDQTRERLCRVPSIRSYKLGSDRSHP